MADEQRVPGADDHHSRKVDDFTSALYNVMDTTGQHRILGDHTGRCKLWTCRKIYVIVHLLLLKQHLLRVIIYKVVFLNWKKLIGKYQIYYYCFICHGMALKKQTIFLAFYMKTVIVQHCALRLSIHIFYV
jgi:hypothetical protein